MILVYVVCKDKEEGDNIAKLVVKKRLAACANLFPISSFYYWDDKLTEDNEVVLLLKTISDNYESLEKEIKELHSYDIPAIIKINAESNGEYENWIKKNTAS
tara:strand:- start:627 stop:932 length:306 start_codon:yes stop_codon:yes gene_type:complete